MSDLNGVIRTTLNAMQQLESRVEFEQSQQQIKQNMGDGQTAGEVLSDYGIELETDTKSEATDQADSTEETSSFNPYDVKVSDLSDVDDEKLQQAYNDAQKSAEEMSQPKSEEEVARDNLLHKFDQFPYG